MAMENWDIYDGNGKPLGYTRMRGDAFAPGEYHLVAEVRWVFLSKYLYGAMSPNSRPYGLLRRMGVSY